MTTARRTGIYIPGAPTVVHAMPIARKFLATKEHGVWELGKVIGEGANGKCRMATNTETRDTCVIKSVNRTRLRDSVKRNIPANDRSDIKNIWKREMFQIREASISMLLDHPNICRMFASVVGENHFYCLFEHIPGEDLIDYTARCGYLPADEARLIFRQVLSAVDYAHRNSVVHRDIKLENIRYNAQTGLAVILDFGFATFYDQTHSNHLLTNCGSPSYAAPEIFGFRPYIGPEIDVWSLGICLYGMTCGSLPFEAPGFPELAAQVEKGAFVVPSHISDTLEDLLRKMLTVDPQRRISLQGVLHHPWTLSGYDSPPITPTTPTNQICPDMILDLVNRPDEEAAIILCPITRSERPLTRDNVVTYTPSAKTRCELACDAILPTLSASASASASSSAASSSSSSSAAAAAANTTTRSRTIPRIYPPSPPIDADLIEPVPAPAPDPDPAPVPPSPPQPRASKIARSHSDEETLVTRDNWFRRLLARIFRFSSTHR
ncbi:hypothetical protein SeMB42_g02362 [Synchytrium endobioticum]|uniref:Protein kinase domain-containing protein n=1 Tax=Synchytrium endobioticum TaxID=286115 RepID=A0A507DEX2_9FUNG|nr:hypothetical protein SeMB42_g02362 [Synchytrium endobioticum]